MTMTTRPIEVLLVDDHRLLTDSLARLLAAEPDIEIIGIAAAMADAKGSRTRRMDVVLMDYRLPDGTGAEATRAIKARWPTARVVMLTAVQDDETVLESIQAGADGYRQRPCRRRRGRYGPQRACRRDAPAAVGDRRHRQARCGSAGSPGRAPPIETLTARELQILQALAEGMATPDICERLSIAQYAPDARPEHHDEAARALEAGGRDRGPPPPDHRPTPARRSLLTSRSLAVPPLRGADRQVASAWPPPAGGRRVAPPPAARWRRALPDHRAGSGADA